jgi:hypothetical protein
MPVDDEARSIIPDLAAAGPVLEVTETQVSLRFGALLQFEVPRGLVRGASLLPDPRPAVFLPPGVSAAVELLGRDTVAAVASHEGLVRLDFSQPIEARTRPIGDTPGTDEYAEEDAPESQPSGESTLRLQHLIIAVDEPEALVREIGATQAVETPS